jgi:plasmid stabilization system protein ParE
MRLVLHPKVYSDIDEIMRYYERVATPELADEFYTELRYFLTRAADKPESFQSANVISGERTCGGFLIIFCSASSATKSEFSSSAITIDIHLLDPGVDRSMAELEECRPEWSWISVGTSGGRGRDSESVQAIWKNVQAVAVLG